MTTTTIIVVVRCRLSLWSPIICRHWCAPYGCHVADAMWPLHLVRRKNGERGAHTHLNGDDVARPLMCQVFVCRPSLSVATLLTATWFLLLTLKQKGRGIMLLTSMNSDNGARPLTCPVVFNIYCRNGVHDGVMWQYLVWVTAAWWVLSVERGMGVADLLAALAPPSSHPSSFVMVAAAHGIDGVHHHHQTSWHVRKGLLTCHVVTAM
jgi:hypothetical protein